MEKQLNYVAKLSLQQMALRRVAIALWNEHDILSSIGKFRFRDGRYQKEWRETIEEKVADKVLKLHLPESLKKQMKPMLKPIGLQILRWKMFHEEYLGNSTTHYEVPVLSKLCWTTAGAVDYHKTAEKLVRSNVLSIVQRYILASLYCLEDNIAEIWLKLSEFDKSYFYSKGSELMGESQLEFCWPYILDGEESVLDNMPGRGQTRFYQNAFQYSACKGNKRATEYFFQKLTPGEREVILMQTAEDVLTSRNIEIYNPTRYDDFPKEKVSEVFCFLLSVMTQEEQVHIFREEPCKVLMCFLNWPLQDFFLGIADFIWTFLPENEYSSMLWKMTKSIRNSGYYFPNLFQTFFQKSPKEFRKRFVERECQFGPFFKEFFDMGDTETIKVVFRSVDAADRLRLVTSEHVFQLFYDFILRGKWRIVEVCLQEASLSKESKDRLKEDFMAFLKDIDRGKIKWRKRKWRRFFEFLDGNEAKAPSKRSLEQGTLTTAKKLCYE